MKKILWLLLMVFLASCSMNSQQQWTQETVWETTIVKKTDVNQPTETKTPTKKDTYALIKENQNIYLTFQDKKYMLTDKITDKVECSELWEDMGDIVENYEIVGGDEQYGIVKKTSELCWAYSMTITYHGIKFWSMYELKELFWFPHELDGKIENNMLLLSMKHNEFIVGNERSEDTMTRWEISEKSLSENGFYKTNDVWTKKINLLEQFKSLNESEPQLPEEYKEDVLIKNGYRLKTFPTGVKLYYTEIYHDEKLDEYWDTLFRPYTSYKTIFIAGPKVLDYEVYKQDGTTWLYVKGDDSTEDIGVHGNNMVQSIFSESESIKLVSHNTDTILLENIDMWNFTVLWEKSSKQE